MKRVLALLLALVCTFSVAAADAVRIGSLKGPTSIGLVDLMNKSEANDAEGDYEFEMVTDASMLISAMVQGSKDIVLIPANAAALLYQKSNAAVSVIDINTLGVLYCVTGRDDIHAVADLAGKTVLTTGQGTTPEYSLRYLLAANNVTDCTLEFASEATEIAAKLTEDPQLIAVLPQPFVTATLVKNDALKSVFSLSDEWDLVSTDSGMVTGVTVVRKAFLEENPEAVATFLKEHAASVEAVNADAAAAAELVVKYEIIAAVPVATQAIPNCSVVCITGEEMKTKLSGYLTVLFNADASSVGGAVPADDFYYIP